MGAGKIKDEGVGPPECSPPARRRRAAGEADGTDESLLSEGAATEAAWPRAPARGRRAGTETEIKKTAARSGRPMITACAERTYFLLSTTGFSGLASMSAVAASVISRYRFSGSSRGSISSSGTASMIVRR